MAWLKYGIRAKFLSLEEGHRRFHAVGASFITGCCDNAPLPRVSADNNRSAPEMGVTPLLDGGKERVEVEVCHIPLFVSSFVGECLMAFLGFGWLVVVFWGAHVG